LSARRYDSAVVTPSLLTTLFGRGNAGRVFALIAALASLGCGREVPRPTRPKTPAAATSSAVAPPPPAAPKDAPAPGAVDPELTEAMRDAALYLARACGHDGQFVYRRDLVTGRYASPGYNELRHAGAIYALADYQARWPTPEVAAAIGRATRYLWTFAEPVKHEPGALAIWSAKNADEAKLGGAGLALVAVATLERTSAASAPLTPADKVEGLLRFVDWMQRPDGSFYSKYRRGAGRDDSWTSLYYPGEAALGVTLAGGSRWQTVAIDALMFLARSRRGAAKVPPDHWALIATGAVLRNNPWLPKATRKELLDHARRIVDGMIDALPKHAADSPWFGSWGSDARTTPAATRLEGLIAALDYLDAPGDDSRRARMRTRIADGIAFLLRARVADGDDRGAMPRSARWQDPSPPSPRSAEIRIDYVQHALSAWIGWAAQTRPGGQPAKPSATPSESPGAKPKSADEAG
jgi:hypothetical protein